MVQGVRRGEPRERVDVEKAAEQILHLVGDVIPLGLRGVHLAGADEPEEGLLIVVREREGTDEEGV